MKSLSFLICFSLVVACSGTKAMKDSNTETMPDNSMTSLDWQGTYNGIVPCLDCEGIETALTLREDRTYLLKTKYLGKNEAINMINGSFSWNKEGSIITLIGIYQGPSQYLVGENGLVQLDMKGNRITGEHAQKYVLKKFIESEMKPNASLTETYWKLIELNGNRVPPPAENVREIHIVLRNDEARVTGFAGCNAITGTYIVQEGWRLKFAQIGSTLMACERMEIEKAFGEMLERIDSYSIKGDNLSLNKARMAPLARFEAVYL